jgi:hypothetical protein
MRGVLAVLPLAVLLCGCTLVRSDVTRFDQLPQDTAGKSVYFLPLEEQATSAAYLTYSGQIAAELAKYGMHRADDIETADYALVLAYGSVVAGKFPARFRFTGRLAAGPPTIPVRCRRSDPAEAHLARTAVIATARQLTEWSA